MKILGINDSHNASACLLDDGKLIMAIQEERLCRMKSWSGFPNQSIQWILDEASISSDQIDLIAFLGNSAESPVLLSRLQKVLRLAQLPLTSYVWHHLHLPSLYTRAMRPIRQRKRRSTLESLGFLTNRIYFVDHHLAHAASAYYGWGRMDTPVLILTADGSGDGLCATVNLGENGQLTRLAAVDTSASLGILYAIVTLLLRMVPNEHETKVMGLAPYAHSEEVEILQSKLKAQFRFSGLEGIVWSREKGQGDVRISYPSLKKLMDNHRFDVIAGGVQSFLEAWLSEWVHRCVNFTGIHRIALAGGIFMNVKANKAIGSLECVDDLFIFPSCGDETGSIGAAMWAFFDQTHMPPEPLKHLYLGPEYSDSQIKSTLKDYSTSHYIQWKPIKNTADTVAQLLSSGQIVAFHGGPMEFGARALGNRSIFAPPGNLELIHVINESIKGRDFWMPFAPAILDYRANDYLFNPKSFAAQYMIMAFDTTDRRSEIAATIHPWDHTVRPQIVSNAQNPFLYQMIKSFESLTGCGVVLNTSFNLHGEPIVMSPYDSLDVFTRSGLKYLVMGNYLVEKGQRT